MDDYSGAYIISRSKKYKPPRGKRFAGVLIVVLLLLTSAICLLIIFLPKITTAGGEAAFSGRTFYFLATDEAKSRDTAIERANISAARGGAGYIYNDGTYRVVAMAYGTESEAKQIAAHNPGAFVFSVSIPAVAAETEDARAIEYVCGEWFSALSGAAKDLDRGVMTDAQAELAAERACASLSDAADKVQGSRLKRALSAAGEFSVPDGMSLLSYIRHVTVRGIALVSKSLS